MSLLVTLTPEGEIVDYQITPSLIRVAERLTYQDADARIGHELQLTQGFEIAQRLRQSRFDNGAIALPIPDAAPVTTAPLPFNKFIFNSPIMLNSPVMAVE